MSLKIDKSTPIGTPLIPVVMGWGKGPFILTSVGKGGGSIRFATTKDGVQRARASDFRVDIDAVRGGVRKLVKENGRQSLTAFERAVIENIEDSVGGG